MEQQAAANSTFWLGLYWVGITLAGILSLFGVKKLVELLFTDWLVRRKAKEAAHDTNEAARIAADTTLVKSLIDRISKLESGHDSLQLKLSEALAKVARLEEKNINLSERNGKLERENEERRAAMHRLRNDLAGRDLKIMNLEHEVDKLKMEMHGTSAADHASQTATNAAASGRMDKIESEMHEKMSAEITPDGAMRVSIDGPVPVPVTVVSDYDSGDLLAGDDIHKTADTGEGQ